MKGKLKFILPLVALILLGGAYKTVLAKPAPKPKPMPKKQLAHFEKRLLEEFGFPVPEEAELP